MMRYSMWAVVVAAVAAAGIGMAIAADDEYTLKDYMPRTVGSTWTMQTTGGGPKSTMEVLKPEDIGDKQVSALVTKTAEGAVRSASYETVDADNLIIYGTLFGGRQGGEPRKVLYDPPAKFKGKVKVGDVQEATYQMSMGGQNQQVTMKLTLEAVENVTVPKGTFEGCLKLVTTTKFADREMTRTTWYARGVGTVKTERQGRDGQTVVTELVDYKLAEE